MLAKSFREDLTKLKQGIDAVLHLPLCPPTYKARQLQRKLDGLLAAQADRGQRVKVSTLNKLRNAIANLKVDYDERTSLSGSHIKKLKAWVTSLPRDRLEFYMLSYPLEGWRATFDLLHLKPSELKLDYFQKVRN